MKVQAILRRLATAVVLLGSAGLIGRSMLRLYSVPDEYGPFLRPARDFLTAATALDSTRLVRLGAAPAAISWALEAARHSPELLQRITRGLYVGGGMQRGNHRVVLFGAKGLAPCSTLPLKIFFQGAAGHATIEDIVLECQSYSAAARRR